MCLDMPLLVLSILINAVSYVHSFLIELSPRVGFLTTLRSDCDNSIQNGGTLAPDGDALCNMPCSGNKAQSCGCKNRLDVYSYGHGNETA